MHNVIVFFSQFKWNTIKVLLLLYITDELGKHVTNITMMENMSGGLILR